MTRAGRGAPPAVPAEAAVVARGSLVNLAAMVTGAALAFGLTVLVSRWLQPSGAGAFFELVALFTILSNTFELGADTGLTRWISRARAIGGIEDVRRIVMIALVPVLIIGIAAGAAMWVAAPELARIFLHGLPPGAAAADVRIVALLVPLGALSSCILDGARGFGRMWPYLVIEGLGKPLARVVLVLAAVTAGWGLRGALIAWGLPIVIGLVAGWLIFTAIIRAEVPVRPGTRASARRRARAEHARRAAARKHETAQHRAEPVQRRAVPVQRRAVPVQRDRSARPAEYPDPARPAREGLVPPPEQQARARARPARAEFPVTPELAATLELPAILDVPVPAQAPASHYLRNRDRGRHRGTSRPARQRLAAEFWKFTAPRGAQGTFQVVILWLDILLVGAMVSRYAAGVYAAVSKLAIVGTFALEANRLAIGPQLSALLARREHDRAARLYQNATRWLMLASWPFYLILAIFPAVVLHIFGPRYTAGAAALAVLSLAMLVNLGTGNITVVLLMGGKSSWSAINAGAALIVNVGLNLVLLPRIGILGAAIAWGASIVVDNVTAMIEVRWVLGLAPFGPGYGLAAATTVGCFGATGLAARALLGQTRPALAVAVAAGLAAFAGVLYLARAPLQLTGMSAALRLRAVPVAPSQAEQAA
jgi:O-antigen/teichoic acid export membrane protein